MGRNVEMAEVGGCFRGFGRAALYGGKTTNLVAEDWVGSRSCDLFIYRLFQFIKPPQKHFCLFQRVVELDVLEADSTCIVFRGVFLNPTG